MDFALGVNQESLANGLVRLFVIMPCGIFMDTSMIRQHEKKLSPMFGKKVIFVFVLGISLFKISLGGYISRTG